MNIYKAIALYSVLTLGAGCAATNKTPEQAHQATAQDKKLPESRIEGNFPADSPFAKIKLGMTQGEVHAILGQPTDTKSYQTGKAWIPFYFGPDMMRTDEFYKGVGIITYAGSGIGGVHWKVFRAIYNAAQNGFPND